MLPQMFASAAPQELIGQREYEESFQRLSAALNESLLCLTCDSNQDLDDGEYLRITLIICQR